MNKVLLLSDKEQLPEAAFHFAKLLNQRQKILLTGVFLPELDYQNLMLLPSLGDTTPFLSPYAYYLPDAGPAVGNKQAISRFNALCRQQGIECRVHELEDVQVLPQLLRETRYADLMVFSSLPFFEDPLEKEPNENALATLHTVECPVLVIPESFQMPENIILAYDGSASSAFAIRQFASILPEFTGLETLLVYADPHPDAEIPDLAYIEELAARHYPNLTILKLELDPKKYFDVWLADRRNSLLVTGSYGRGGLSRFLHESFIGAAFRAHQLPVFIAHR